MLAYMTVYIHVYRWSHTLACNSITPIVSSHTCTRMHTCTHTCTHTHMHTYMYILTCAHMYACTQLNEPLHSTDEMPTMPALGSLTKRDGTTFSVIDEIGIAYSRVGTQLLQDDMGTIMDGITHNVNDAAQINRRILQRWLTGTGVQPKTWRTLVNLLRSNTIHLGTLASAIERALQ